MQNITDKHSVQVKLLQDGHVKLLSELRKGDTDG